MDSLLHRASCLIWSKLADIALFTGDVHRDKGSAPLINEGLFMTPRAALKYFDEMETLFIRVM